jgi:hypothetical protein
VNPQQGRGQHGPGAVLDAELQGLPIELGVTELDEATVEATLGTVVKYREDQERTRQHGIANMVKQAFERGMQQP